MDRVKLALDPELVSRLGGLPQVAQEALLELARTRHGYIEALASALVSIDPEAPEKYRLVEEMSQDGSKTRVTWHFERIEG